MGTAIFFDIQKYNQKAVKELSSGVYEGRIIKLSNNSQAYSVQLRNGYVVNNVIGEAGLNKYTNVTILFYGTGNNRATIIKSEKAIEYYVPEYEVSI